MIVPSGVTTPAGDRSTFSTADQGSDAAPSVVAAVPRRRYTPPELGLNTAGELSGTGGSQVVMMAVGQSSAAWTTGVRTAASRCGRDRAAVMATPLPRRQPTAGLDGYPCI